MPRPIKHGSVTHRILKLLSERYPITEAEVALALALRRDVVHLEIERLRREGTVTAEEVSGHRWVALTGLHGKRARPPPRPDDDPAFM